MANLFDLWFPFERKPQFPGWYAGLRCYDEAEGAWPHADYWDGTKFECGYFQYYDMLFSDKESAEAWAKVNILGF